MYPYNQNNPGYPPAGQGIPQQGFQAPGMPGQMPVQYGMPGQPMPGQPYPGTPAGQGFGGPGYGGIPGQSPGMPGQGGLPYHPTPGMAGPPMGMPSQPYSGIQNAAVAAGAGALASSLLSGHKGHGGHGKNAAMAAGAAALAGTVLGKLVRH